jgi:hypothetical protein
MFGWNWKEKHNIRLIHKKIILGSPLKRINFLDTSRTMKNIYLVIEKRIDYTSESYLLYYSMWFLVYVVNNTNVEKSVFSTIINNNYLKIINTNVVYIPKVNSYELFGVICEIFLIQKPTMISKEETKRLTIEYIHHIVFLIFIKILASFLKPVTISKVSK